MISGRPHKPLLHRGEITTVKAVQPHVGQADRPHPGGMYQIQDVMVAHQYAIHHGHRPLTLIIPAVVPRRAAIVTAEFLV